MDSSPELYVANKNALVFHRVSDLSVVNLKGYEDEFFGILPCA